MVFSSKKIDKNSFFRPKMTKNHSKSLYFFVLFWRFQRFFAVLELVLCVGHSITFCVLRLAFHHNIPTLENIDFCCFFSCICSLGHLRVILRDLKLFWVIVRKGHLRSFQGERGNFKNKLCEKLHSLGSRSESQFLGL